MEENTTYRLSEITVNADELRRIRDDLDEHLASGLSLWRRVDNLIMQGTIPSRKHDTNTPGRDAAQKDIETKAREGYFSGLHG